MHNWALLRLRYTTHKHFIFLYFFPSSKSFFIWRYLRFSFLSVSFLSRVTFFNCGSEREPNMRRSVRYALVALGPTNVSVSRRQITRLMDSERKWWKKRTVRTQSISATCQKRRWTELCEERRVQSGRAKEREKIDRLGEPEPPF